MNAQEKLLILANASERGFRKLEEATMGEENTTALLTNLHQVEVLINAMQIPIPGFAEIMHPEHTIRITDSVDTETPAPIEEHEAAKELTSNGPDAATLEKMKAQTRTELARLSAANPGLNVSAIMAEMGYDKLSEVPWTQYEELLGRAREQAGVK